VRSAAECGRLREEVAVESLLGELETQRRVLRERDRLLARERARLRRITESLPYRAYMKLASLPGIGGLRERRGRRRRMRNRARSEQRARVRRERTQRFTDHHRGQ
jgi:hypothetical protein